MIWTALTPAALAARQATATIPIVVALAADPVAVGLAQSLSRPGGNVTGLSMLNTDIAPKLLELLKELLPSLARVGVLSNPGETTNPVFLRTLPSSARALQVSLVSIELRTPEEIEPAVENLSRQSVDAVLIPGGALFLAHARQITRLLAQHRLPSAGNFDNLLSYGPDTEESRRRSASQVDRILKGAKPAEMPIEQASRFELVVDLKAARATGLTVPRSLLLRADRVIE